jgi:SAM-dependent methyltransferase
MDTFACACCGTDDFQQVDVLWPALVKEWQLEDAEVEYINRQQGLSCSNCGVTLRAMTLARAILNFCDFDGTLEQFVADMPELRLLEVNEAGNINHLLRRLPNHVFASYPNVDLTSLPFEEHTFDLVVHSDTLEHVSEPIKALRETLRVLRPGGATCYTVPVVVGRMSKRRANDPSYHGNEGNDEFLVVTEYGADMWTQLMEAGFHDCRLCCLEYPTSIAITGVRDP